MSRLVADVVARCIVEALAYARQHTVHPDKIAGLATLTLAHASLVLARHAGGTVEDWLRYCQKTAELDDPSFTALVSARVCVLGDALDGAERPS